ncbi:MAG TPA: CBS domain-containing protein [Actinomycetota bacterium]|nr:CBS domain-containing protein [Actinomycetota bacterium]
MSPRAAWRLESLGFERVYDYEAGKQNWLASGLPTEGSLADVPRAGDVARDDVPTCGLEERLGEVAERVRAAGWDTCVVVNDERVVLGLLRAAHLARDPDLPVADAMSAGPSTFRPHVYAMEMARYMTEHDLPSAPVTTGEGVLVGLLVREDAVRVAEEAHRALHEREHGYPE